MVKRKNLNPLTKMPSERIIQNANACFEFSLLLHGVCIAT